MGGGSWTSNAFEDYTYSVRNCSVNDFEISHYSAQELYKSRGLSPVLNPYKVMRECCDSDEHPNTLPVILALDVTGSMGGASVKVAQKLNQIMTDLYADDTIQDIEFCIMGIGDIAYDRASIQISQFESDIRIAEQLDEIYFEAGGGGNSYESYTGAWYMGLNHCNLDCWARGKKGLIITMGDELPNPYLPRKLGSIVEGRDLQDDIETKDLLTEAKEKFEIHHIAVDDVESSYGYYKRKHIDEEWTNLLGEENYHIANLNNLSKIIVKIIKSHANNNSSSITVSNIQENENGEVTW